MLKLSKMLSFLLLTWQIIVRTNQKLNLLTTTILSSAMATLLMQTTTATLTKVATTATAKNMTMVKMVMISLKTNHLIQTKTAKILTKMATATLIWAILVLATSLTKTTSLMHQAIMFLRPKLTLLGQILKLI